MSTQQNAIEMFVGGLVLDPNTQAPVIILKDEAGNVSLPIWIGIAEATSIASAIKQVSMARPLTHDLMHDVFVEIGIKVERVVITELKDSTYFAELVLAAGEKAIILDARPSDAIALALRATAPIYVMQQVIDQAKQSLPPHFQLPPSAEAAPSDEKTEEQTEEGEDKNDLKHVAKDKWNEILDELDPEDFKYKM
jgi:bifunctional DNase/RNase